MPEADPELVRLSAELEARCKTAGLRFERVEDSSIPYFVRVYLPSARDTYPISLFSIDRVQALLGVPFERYVLLGDYAAICSYQDGVIEAFVTSLGSLSSRAVYRQIGALSVDVKVSSSEEPTPIRLRRLDGPETINLGPATAALDVLVAPRAPTPRPALRIENVQVARHDDALDLLERLANSFFFQLDLEFDTPLSLAPRRRRAFRRPFPRGQRGAPDLQFPRTEYDRDPISLYWYARSATGMPLLQFLAYYQTLEYYFPTYSQAEARRKIRNHLKHPSFRPDRDADLARILLAARTSGHGYGDERSQLRATVNECVEPGALRAFLTESEERIQFFSAKAEGLTDQRIPIRNADADLRNDVADRIYDIRCKIVHTKSTGRDAEVELLLPFSKEAELLYSDIELVQFVAREVLVSASGVLQL
jgi:hypothetical protein